jgi:uncharacterized protein (TIGR02145 family)
MKTKRFLSAAIFVAISFTFFACSSDGDEPNTGGGGGCSDPNATVPIGGQVWLKCNLNVPHSEGNGESWCYDDDPANCAKYGRLYNWAAAMGLPSECNSESCAGLIQPKHRGICPQGFHIPTNAEWDALYRFADGTSGTESPYDSPTAGQYLKAKEGWTDCGPSGSGSSYQCEDAHGFSALPGGGRSTVGSFDYAGNYGYWWSASESSSGIAYRRYMYCDYDYANWSYGVKAVGFSVRCLQD